MPRVAIIILAAGASKRMGTPKQALPWGNTSLIGHAVQTALKVHATEVAVVLGAHYSYLNSEIKQYRITILNNKDWEMGLGSSIARGVRYLTNIESNVDGVLILLADQPFISSDFLESMILNFEPNKNQIITTLYEEGNQGVPVLFDTLYFDELLQLQDDSGAKHLLKKYKSQVKALIPSIKNVDLDTKEEYQIYRRLQFKN